MFATLWLWFNTFSLIGVILAISSLLFEWGLRRLAQDLREAGEFEDLADVIMSAHYLRRFAYWLIALAISGQVIIEFMKL